MKKTLKELTDAESLLSLNESLYSEFQIKELEERLETDPLAVNSVFSVFSDGGVEAASCFCLIHVTCGELNTEVCVPKVA